MFGTNIVNRGLTFSKVLNGISKSLSIANQVIPLYQQTKPMINNARSIYKTVKSLNGKKSINKPKNNNVIIENKISDNDNNKKLYNRPVFFH